MKSANSFDAIRTFETGGRQLHYFSLAAAGAAGLGDLTSLPVSLKIFLENLLRSEDGLTVTAADIRKFSDWMVTRRSGDDVAFHPSRIVMHDASGLPLLADLAAMRDAIVRLGGSPETINPMIATDIVLDHSVIVEEAGRAGALGRNMDIDYERNSERYSFLRWAQDTFSNLRVIPPGLGIIHQVNLEFLAEVVTVSEAQGATYAFPDTVLGIDSHTPMINGIGVLGWGCGGIEAGSAMLGQPISMSVPDVVGVRLTGSLPSGVTSTDLVLTMTERMRQVGVVQKFVEFFGPGLSGLPVPIRATLANMAPEYGATVGFFPIDRETIAYLRISGRSEEHIAIVEHYAKVQGLWRDDTSAEPTFTQIVDFNLADVRPSIAGPRRPQDRVLLENARSSLAQALVESAGADWKAKRIAVRGKPYDIGNGAVAIAAITSCTNTSTPSVMIAAGLLAKKAVARGLRSKPWVKTSFGPGSRVVTEYLNRAGLQDSLDALGFQVVGYGCTTCMGNSGPLDAPLETAITEGGLSVAAVLSGNRNFEGRIHPLCQLNYLASPPLVVAYALAGTLDIDILQDPLGEDRDGAPVYLRDIWPEAEDVEQVIRDQISPDLYRERYAGAFTGDRRWQELPFKKGATFEWSSSSLYIRRPPFFADTGAEAEPVNNIRGARILAMLGSSITTDHISPIGAISPDSTAGKFLTAQGVRTADFNSFGARRINHDVMIRGTFANARLKNELVPGVMGGYTRYMPDDIETSIYEASQRYRAAGVPLIVVAGADYGVGSSRDWAAKGARLLGIGAIIAESFERIHRTNLIGMGVLPLQFTQGQTRHTLGLTGREIFDIAGLDGGISPDMRLPCKITRTDGSIDRIELLCRLDTAYEVDYYRNGGILHTILRRLIAA